jgi:hypothetical protein
MRLKSKHVMLVALIVVTATPRAFDQLADLKNFAQERFRAELLSIFWSFTPPDTRRGERPNLELLARLQNGPQSSCDSSARTRTNTNARAMRAASGLARASAAPALDLGHRPPLAADEPQAENLVASLTDPVEQTRKAAESAPLDKQENVVLIARNFKDYPLLDETAAPVAIDDAVAQFAWVQEDEAAQLQENETAELPKAQPAAPPQKEMPGVRRFALKPVPVSFQFRMLQNLDEKVINVGNSSQTFIQTPGGLVPAKVKCPVHVRVAPSVPRVAEKPALIS